jgi:inner membrane protein
MTARAHDLFAFACLVTAGIYFTPDKLTLGTAGLSLIGSIFGALAPDLDQGGNKLWSLLPAGNILGKIGRRIFYKHRTISHSLLGGFALYKLLQLILPKLLNSQFVDINIVLMATMIGFASHLIADSITKEGLPLFFPFKFKIAFPPFEFLRITTGSWTENLIILPGIFAYLIWLIASNQNKALDLLRLLQE